MNKRDFVRIGIAGTAGAMFVPMDLMAGMVEPALKTKLAGGLYYTETAFGRWNQGLADHHLPKFDKQGSSLHVATNHPMNAYEHWIIKHQLLDSNFNFITENSYNPKSDKPESTFDISGHSGVIYVLTMCNVHDLWVNATEA